MGTGSIRTVCLFLGPYRNLTTLTASVLSLHPFCQVLNHGGERVLGVPAVDFLADTSRETFARFCDFALEASQGGRRGDYGGSITLSHAFDSDLIREAYGRRYGDSLLKERVETIVWKESLRVARAIRERGVDVSALLQQNEEIRFVMPVRNPLDCAVSNLKTGHARLFGGERTPDVREVADAILGELAWFHELAQRHGAGRFFSFFEFEIDRSLITRLADFLQLAPDARWVDDASRCFVVKPSYEHDGALREWYGRRVAQRFAGHPELIENLGRFAAR